MFFKSKRTVINSQIIKAKTDKISKRIRRDAKKRIRKHELLDARSFAMYLKYIDGEYSHITADVRNATQVADYSFVRSSRIAETRQLLAFYDSNFDELRRLYSHLVEQAKNSGHSEDLKKDIVRPPDMSELKEAFNKLTSDTEQTSRQGVPVRPVAVR